MRCCFICFWNHVCCLWKEVPYNNGSLKYCTLSWICSGFGDYEKTPGGMSDGVSVCVRAVCKLNMQTIWDIQHIHVSYKNKKRCSQSLNSYPRETGMYSIYISPLITMKSKTCSSVLGCSSLQHLNTRLDNNQDKTKLESAGLAFWSVVSKRAYFYYGQTSPHLYNHWIHMFWPWQFTI